MESYEEFLATKRLVVTAAGREVADSEVHPGLFPFQRQLVRWAVRKGRCALFATTGMGKTRMQLEWARLTGERTLILAPLAVTRQTVREAAALDLTVTYARRQAEAPEEGITITNYEMLDRFRADAFAAVVLDESSILKAFSGATKKALCSAFRSTPYRLCCTATPAPNDVVELCNHADFLGIMKQNEMISTFFTPRGVENSHAGQYRLKSHARAAFYRWLASWSMALTKPSDLGFSDAGYDLPPLSIEPVIVESEWAPPDRLFLARLEGVTQRAQVRRETVAARVGAAVREIEADPGEQWLIWCGLNEESDRMTRALGAHAVEVRGDHSPEFKAEMLELFAAGIIQYLVTKPSIAGFGMNLQRCARMAFVGLGDSYETYFQAIRRCWRYGQTRPVRALVVLSGAEQVIYENVLRKEAQAATLTAELIRHVAEFERQEIRCGSAAADYQPGQRMRLPAWLECSGGRIG